MSKTICKFALGGRLGICMSVGWRQSHADLAEEKGEYTMPSNFDLDNLLQRVESLYCEGDYKTIVQTCEGNKENLQSVSCSIKAGLVCRTVMLAYYGLEKYETGDEWYNYAFSHFDQCAWLPGMGLLLLPPFFYTALGKKEDWACAEKIGQVFTHLITKHYKHGDEAYFDYEDLERICYEKRAYLNAKMGRWDAAIKLYESALNSISQSASDPFLRRSELKVRGGLALARYQKHADNSIVIYELESIVKECGDDSTLAWVKDVARKNLGLINEKFVPYEELEKFEIE